MEFLLYNSTVNIDQYCEYLEKLTHAIQNRKCGLLSCGVIFHQDNATPQKVNKTNVLLYSFGWNVLNHLAHSLDLAPSDYHPFLMEAASE